jgi:SAM-dependent methyltransferase
MSGKTNLRAAIVKQFGRPTGTLGRLVGFIMKVRPSNRQRNLRTVETLDVQPDDHVLEIGFGPGLAIQRAAELAIRGRVVGVDHSEVMLKQASRRNAQAIAMGRVELHLGAAEALPPFQGLFDKAFAVNVFMFWADPLAVLGEIRDALKPGGTLAVTFQPRNRAAKNADTREGAERIAKVFREAGFQRVRVEILEMPPVDAACVLGHREPELEDLP